DLGGRRIGMELVLADWFYAGIVDPSRVLTIDAGYFGLTGGIERWLYRLVRKHAGYQSEGWRFDFRHLYSKWGRFTRFSDFAADLRRIVARQSLPGYCLSIVRKPCSSETLSFRAVPSAAPKQRSRRTSRCGQVRYRSRIHSCY